MYYLNDVSTLTIVLITTVICVLLITFHLARAQMRLVDLTVEVACIFQGTSDPLRAEMLALSYLAKESTSWSTTVDIIRDVYPQTSLRKK